MDEAEGDLAVVETSITDIALGVFAGIALFWALLGIVVLGAVGLITNFRRKGP